MPQSKAFWEGGPITQAVGSSVLPPLTVFEVFKSMEVTKLSIFNDDKLNFFFMV